jgi:uncharacterized protein DUF6752
MTAQDNDRGRIVSLGDRLRTRLRREIPSPAAPQPRRASRSGGTDPDSLAARVTALEDAVAENRRLNQRLADVVDVVTEVLVPVADRDDKRLAQALKNLNKTLDAEAPKD